MTFEIVVDAKTPFVLAHFWAEALKGYQVRPYDDKEIAHLASLGLTPETDPSVPIDTVHGPTVCEVHDNHTVMFDPEGNQFCLFDP